MRSAVSNPFHPGSDVVPPVWAGRIAQVNDWRDVLRPRLLAGLPERGRTILGEAGAGKSTLVRRIAAIAEEAEDWTTPQVRIPTGTDPLKRVATELLALAGRSGLPTSRDAHIGRTLKRVREISLAGTGVALDPSEGPEPYTALTNLLVEIGRRAIDHGKVVVVHIDEVQNLTDDDVRSQLLICLGDALAYETTVAVPGGRQIKRGLPIAVYLTGLPEFADLTGAKKGATFARRFATTTLAPIDDTDFAAALQPFVNPGWEVLADTGAPGRVRMEPAAVEAIIDVCRGEPFLFQLAGQRAWYAGSGDTITADEVRAGWVTAVEEATAHVERILGRLPDRERQMLDAMAALDPAQRTATRIATEMGYQAVSQAGPTAQRLDTVRGIINRGAPYSFRHRAVEAYLTTGWPRL